MKKKRIGAERGPLGNTSTVRCRKVPWLGGVSMNLEHVNQLERNQPKPPGIDMRHLWGTCKNRARGRLHPNFARSLLQRALSTEIKVEGGMSKKKWNLCYFK